MSSKSNSLITGVSEAFSTPAPAPTPPVAVAVTTHGARRRPGKYTCPVEGCNPAGAQQQPRPHHVHEYYPSRLLVHYRTHTNRRPYVCVFPGCCRHASFMTACSLEAHIRLVHFRQRRAADPARPGRAQVLQYGRVRRSLLEADYRELRMPSQDRPVENVPPLDEEEEEMVEVANEVEAEEEVEVNVEVETIEVMVDPEDVEVEMEDADDILLSVPTPVLPSISFPALVPAPVPAAVPAAVPAPAPAPAPVPVPVPVLAPAQALSPVPFDLFDDEDPFAPPPSLPLVLSPAEQSLQDVAHDHFLYASPLPMAGAADSLPGFSGRTTTGNTMTGPHYKQGLSADKKTIIHVYYYTEERRTTFRGDDEEEGEEMMEEEGPLDLSMKKKA